MAEITSAISSANSAVSVTVPEIVGLQTRVHSVSGGFIPAPAGGEEAHMTLSYDATAAGRWPVYTAEHVPFPVELLAPEGDGAGAGDVTLTLNAGGDGVVGYIALTYTQRR